MEAVRPDGRRRRGEDGSVLMLMPAAVLVMLVLAAIAVDAAIAYLGHRELANASVAAANDAATLSLSDSSFYEGGEIATDAHRLEQLAEDRVRAGVDARRLRGLVVEAEAIPPPSGECSWTVVIRARADVDYLFARAVPGGPDVAEVRATARASPRDDPGTC